MINSKNHLRKTGNLIESDWTLFFWQGFEKCIEAKKEGKVAALIKSSKKCVYRIERIRKNI